MAEKIRVAVVLPHFGTGGAEGMVSLLAAAIDAEEFNTEVFCVYGKPLNNHLEQALTDRGIKIHFIGKKRGPSLRAVWRLFRALDEFDPQVVHTHLYACVYAALWPMIRRKPMLHTFHSLPTVENRKWLRRVLTKSMVRSGRMIPVAISRENARLVGEYYGIAPGGIPVVNNPVNVARFASVEKTSDGVFRFITVGRFSPVKNQDMMLRAFGDFLSRGHDARLVMVGGGEEEGKLKALAGTLGIADRVELPGYVVDVENYLAGADVFLLSSLYEAQPLAVLEAMAAGLPVISTDVGGVRDIVTDNGILIPPEDAAALTDAMERLYGDHALRAEMAARGAENAARYDVKHTARQYMMLYRVHSKK